MQGHIVRAFDNEIDSLKKKLAIMAKRCEEQLNRSAESFSKMDVELAKAVIKEDDHINGLQTDIQEETVKMLARRQPMAVDLRQILSMMKIASELERIGDYAASIAKRVLALSDIPAGEFKQLIIEMAAVGAKMIHDAVNAFLTLDIKQAMAVWHRDDEIDTLFAALISIVEKQMQADSISVENGTQLIFMGRCCERIGDHITNIAEDVYYIRTGQNYISQFEDQ